MRKTHAGCEDPIVAERIEKPVLRLALGFDMVPARVLDGDHLEEVAARGLLVREVFTVERDSAPTQLLEQSRVVDREGPLAAHVHEGPR